MADIVRLYNFMARQTCEAEKFDAELDQIIAFLNNDVIHKDGSKAFTGLPTLPENNPSSDNHMVPKHYVDSRVLASTIVRLEAGIAPETEITSTTYVDFPTTANVVQGSIVKQRTDTVIRVSYECRPFSHVAGTAPTVRWGVMVDGGTVLDVGQAAWNTAGDTLQVFGMNDVTGLGIGTHTFKLQWKKLSGTTKVSHPSAAVCFKIEEARAL